MHCTYCSGRGCRVCRQTGVSFSGDYKPNKSSLNESNSITVGHFFVHPKTKKEIYIRKSEKWKLFKMRSKLKIWKLLNINQ